MMPMPATSDSGSSNVPTRGDILLRCAGVVLLVGSVSFFSVVTTVQSLDPGYFQRLLLADAKDELDPIETGAVSAEAAEPRPDITALPVPDALRASAAEPGDYQIVMVFEGAAHLATRDTLWRVEVGSRVPGLGTIQTIETTPEGGLIEADAATLRAVPADR